MMLYLIIPCYNEEEMLPVSHSRLQSLLLSLSVPSSVVYVDDGSSDGTWPLIERLCATDGRFHGLRLSRNVGQQTASWAGLEHCVSRGDAFVTLDADLQDDPEAVRCMVVEWMDGADVVYGVRRSRRDDTFVKRSTARFFYRLMGWLGCETVYEHSEFRLLSRRAAEALLSYPERNLFVRGLVPLLGFDSRRVYFDRQPRLAGETKYGFLKLAGLAFEGVTSFSVRPLHWILVAGLLFILVALCVIGWALYNHFTGRTVTGWTSLLVSLWFVGGILLLALGVTGEYVGKIYRETKRRPRYFVRQEV